MTDFLAIWGWGTIALAALLVFYIAWDGSR
jgi:hypothetical protein